jgi:hypothetical protein
LMFISMMIFIYHVRLYMWEMNWKMQNREDHLHNYCAKYDQVLICQSQNAKMSMMALKMAQTTCGSDFWLYLFMNERVTEAQIQPSCIWRQAGQEQQMELECDCFVYYTLASWVFVFFFFQKQRIVCNECGFRIAHLANRLEDRGWNQSHWRRQRPFQHSWILLPLSCLRSSHRFSVRQS